MSNELLQQMLENGMLTPDAVMSFAEPERSPFTVGSLADNPFDDIEQKTGGYQYDMPDSVGSAVMQTMLVNSQSSLYGGLQWAGYDDPRYEAKRKWTDEMERHYGTPITIAKIAGQLLDPVNWYGGAARAVKGAEKGWDFIKGTALSGAKGGAAAGALEYIPEGTESLLGTGYNRAENAALGGVVGGVAGPVFGATAKGIAKAYEPIGDMFWKTLGTPTGAGGTIGAIVGFEMEPENEEDRMRNAVVISALGMAAFNSPKFIDMAYSKFGKESVISQSKLMRGGLPLTREGQSWAEKGYTLQEGLGSWLIPNYGRSQQYVTALRKMRASEGLYFQEFDDLIQEIRDLKWGERKILYRMLQGEEFPDMFGERVDIPMLRGLNDRSREKIKELGKYLVDIGMLDSKVNAKNADTYLTTSYMKHEFAKFVDPLERLHASNLLFHRRGNMQTMSADAFSKGQRPDDLGEWEILDELPLGQVRVRRQWTKQEKTEMGEIEDSAYAMIKTARSMSKEAAMGGFYKDLADAQGIVVKEGTPNAMMLPDRPEWGALRGKHVDKKVYEDLLAMRQIYQPTKGEKLWQYIQAGTGTWKGLKTIATPAVHFNNMVSSMHMYDLAGGNYSEIPKIAAEMLSRGKLYRQMVEDGVFGANFVEGELDDVTRQVYDAYKGTTVRFKSNPNEGLRDAWDIVAKFTRNTVGKTWKAAGDLYALEDNIWRAGLYKTKLDQALSRGMDEKSARAFAAEQAAKWFVDYDLGGTPVLNALRKTALPFFSYTYGTTPRLVEAAVKNPASYAKWAGIYHLLNDMGQDHSGYSDKYFEDAAQMEDTDDKMFGMRFMPSAKIVMPAFIADKLFPNAEGPIALNMSRAMPLGTFNMQSTQESPGGAEAGKVPWLPDNLQPNFGLIGAIGGPMLNVNLGFGGKIREGETGSTILKNVLPNWQILPGTYAYEKKEKADALKEIKGSNLFSDDWSPTTATLSNIGPRFEVVDNSKLRSRLGMQFDKKIREKESAINSIKRDARYRLEVKQGGKGRLHQKIEKLIKEIQELRQDARDKLS